MERREEVKGSTEDELETQGVGAGLETDAWKIESDGIYWSPGCDMRKLMRKVRCWLQERSTRTDGPASCGGGFLQSPVWLRTGTWDTVHSSSSQSQDVFLPLSFINVIYYYRYVIKTGADISSAKWRNTCAYIYVLLKETHTAGVMFVYKHTFIICAIYIYAICFSVAVTEYPNK